MDSRHLLFATAALAAAGCTSDDTAAGTGEVETHAVRELRLEWQEQFEIEREFAGLVLPRQSTDVGFERGGELIFVRVDEGDAVAQGAIIAQLDTELLATEANELTAQLDELAARLKLNRANLDRAMELKTRGFAADQQIDELTAEQETIDANRTRVEAALAANRERIAQSSLTAPFGGTVSRRFVDQGAVVSAGQPVLRIIESGALEARVGVPVRLAARFAAGDAVEIRAAGERFEGKVLAVGRDVTRATLTIPLRIAFDPAGQAVAGDQAWLAFAEPIDEAGYWVPVSALTDGLRGLWNVYVLGREGEDGLKRLEARDVRILYADEGRAFVRGALAEGDAVVADGLPRLVPGQRVRVLAAGAGEEVETEPGTETGP